MQERQSTEHRLAKSHGWRNRDQTLSGACEKWLSLLFVQLTSIRPYNLGSVYRTCQRIEQIARWTNVDYGECTHPLISAIDIELETSVKNEEEIIALRDKCAFLAETTSSNLTTTQLYSSIDLILLIEQIERLTNILVGRSPHSSIVNERLIDVLD